MTANIKVLAAEVARRVGLPASWPNVNVIAAAIELEAEVCGVSPSDAAEVLVAAAKEASESPSYACPAEWEMRALYRENTIDRFWFEDARWRVKYAYAAFRAQLEAA